MPGSVYVIGHDAIDDAEAPNPPHRVELGGFSIGVYPVTNEEYRAFVLATGAAPPTSWEDPRFGDALHPVTGVSWDEALAYCAWVGGTLPSEAQWEVAARGTLPVKYPWGDTEPTEQAHFAQDWNAGGTARVGAHPSGISVMGCHDMAGNVWEWCLDGWRPNAHELRQGLDPVIAPSNNVRPLRGGCWRSIDPKLQCAYRNWYHRVARHVTIGFRVCIG